MPPLSEIIYGGQAMDTLFLIIVISLIARPVIRLIMRNARLLMVIPVLFGAGYWVGLKFSEISGPDPPPPPPPRPPLPPAPPQVLKYLDEIFGQNQR